MKSASRARARTADAKPRSAVSNRVKFPPGEYTIHTPNECNQLLKNRPIHLKQCAYDGKEVVRVFEKDGFRKLLVPSKELTVYPKIMTTSEFAKILENSHNPTTEEKEAALAAAEREKERLMRESMARKEAIRRMDLRKSHEKQGRLNEIEEEARQRTMHLLERAHNLKLEQEEEIKRCNKLILETKCRAIRDAQIAEKKLLELEHQQEEQRMNEQMEQERLAALRSEEQQVHERAMRQQRFAQVLKEQIVANEEERLIEYERKREEARLANLNSIAQQEAELDKYRELEAERERVRREFIRCNDQIKHFKRMEKEEERIMDMRIQEYQREKTERERRIVEEQRNEQQRKEREKERIAEQALQDKEVQAQIDELNASRIQEEVEREWRRKEKEEAVKRAEKLKKFREERTRQVNSKMKIQAMEVEREKYEIEKILERQREAQCREQREREKKQKRMLAHRSDILKQVNEKEKEKIVSRQKMFEEGLAIRAESEQRKRRLREVMERKCQEMRENKVPEVHINEVKRMMESIK
ncbi:cilia- and flagella-associated protein 45-like [Copidosoma floridanum]|uniref:cilia- and flagella-associated protein 45-like n=1 Tax=Copidosoma floridanum TaxID=29053 RepID=UPI0006C95D90|nr:cilia- and flagella-associated protein 45-like [Copidosoma floridanum]